MTDTLNEQLRIVDGVELGRRLRAARVAKGLTQSQVAGSDISVAYVSRIESGQRRPEAQVLRRLARRLSVPVETLISEVAAVGPDELRLALDYVELALESGEHDEAGRRSQEVLEQLPPFSPELVERAHYLHARALESQGRLDEAIVELEELAEVGSASHLWLPTCIALSRCYREAGDLGKAISCGEAGLAPLAESGLSGSDEAIQLTVTVAAAHFEHGDRGEAVRMCRRAIHRAEQSGSTAARASAYWNASVMESARGSMRSAISLARRALALLGEGSDARNLARLRAQLGSMQLRLDEPDIGNATSTLRQAVAELEASSAGRVDIARTEVALARALLLGGDVSEAAVLAEQVLEEIAGSSPLLAADARVLQGQASAASGDPMAAREAYQDAVRLLTGIGADRTAADLWYEVGTLLEEMGDLDGARQAYRSSAVSAGARVRTATIGILVGV